MPDIAGDFTTNATVTVDGTVSSTIDFAGDSDWFAVQLEAGELIEVKVFDDPANTFVFDTFMSLRNSFGLPLVSNNDYGSSAESRFIFEVKQTGTYYIDVRAWPTDPVDYTISVSTYVRPSPLASLDWGTALDDPQVNVYFARAGETFDGYYTSEGASARDIAMFREAFDILESYTALQFDIVTDPANADFGIVLDRNENWGSTLGYFNPPGEPDAGIGVFNALFWAKASTGPQQGSYPTYIILHELLHGLGLAHPHDTGGTSGIMDGVDEPFFDYGDFNLGQGVFTVMSYNPGLYTGGIGQEPDQTTNRYGFAGSPMAFDVALLQQKYGANMNWNVGDTVYKLPEANAKGTFWQCIWDAGGTDTLQYDGLGSCVIDLRAATLVTELGGGGFISTADRVAGGFTIAHGVVIENAIGGDGPNIITGNDAGNRLTGGVENDVLTGLAGDDTLIGEAGNDVLDGGKGADLFAGGRGRDTVTYASAHESVAVSLQKTFAAKGDAIGDSFQLIENLVGSNFDDILAGDALSNSIRGGNGNDSIYGFGGNDALGGGNGIDSLIGGDGDDTLIGGAGNDMLRGDTDDDHLIGGVGNDLLSGGDDDDWLEGGRGTDRLVGGNGNDGLDGGADADRLSGGDGDDQLDGNFGNDIMTGGTGADSFYFYLVNQGHDVVTDFELGVDRVEIVNSAAENFTVDLSGSSVVITFINDGSTATFRGVTDLAAFQNDIFFLTG